MYCRQSRERLVGKCLEDAGGCCPFYHWYIFFGFNTVEYQSWVAGQEVCAFLRHYTLLAHGSVARILCIKWLRRRVARSRFTSEETPGIIKKSAFRMQETFADVIAFKYIFSTLFTSFRLWEEQWLKYLCAFPSHLQMRRKKSLVVVFLLPKLQFYSFCAFNFKCDV